MYFPEGRLTGADEFRRWYEGVIRIFFDEVHTIIRVSPAWKDDRAVVEVVVNWQARRWRPPAPRSEWLGFDAYQQWEMIRSPFSGSPVILRYVVNELGRCQARSRGSNRWRMTYNREGGGNYRRSKLQYGPVQRMYECFNRNDMDTIRREILLLICPNPGRHTLAGTKKGPKKFWHFFPVGEGQHSGHPDPASDPNTGVDTFGENTVVEVHRGHGTTTVRDASGNESQVALNAYNCTHYQIQNGKIARVQVYISDQYAVDNFFCAVYRYKPIPDRLAD
jgi:hypothetical protein